MPSRQPQRRSPKKPNAYDRNVERILKHLEQVGRSPVDRFTLLRVTATLGDPPAAVNRALQLLIIRGELRRIGNLYIRVPATWRKRQARARSVA